MGLFNYLIVEHPLPDGTDPEGRQFQTKSLPNKIATLRLTAEGQVVVDEPGFPDGTFTEGDTLILDGPLEFHETMARPYLAVFEEGRLVRMQSMTLETANALVWGRNETP
jgi:hypothetical protein